MRLSSQPAGRPAHQPINQRKSQRFSEFCSYFRIKLCYFSLSLSFCVFESAFRLLPGPRIYAIVLCVIRKYACAVNGVNIRCLYKLLFVEVNARKSTVLTHREKKSRWTITLEMMVPSQSKIISTVIVFKNFASLLISFLLFFSQLKYTLKMAKMRKRRKEKKTKSK